MLKISSTALRDGLLSCRRHLVAAGLFSALINILYIAPTIYMLQVYDRVVPTGGIKTLAFLTTVLLFALLTLALLDRARNLILVRTALQLDLGLGARILDRSLQQPQMIEARQSLRDFDTVRSALSGPAVVALCDAPWVPVYILACALMSPWIALVALLGCIVLPLVAWLNDRATSARATKASRIATGAALQQEAAVARADTLRALGMRRAIVARIARQRLAMLAGQTEAGLAAGSYVTLSKFVRLALQSLALAVGALLAIEHQISPGAIFASTFLISRTLAPLEQVIAHWKSLHATAVAIRDLDRLLEGEGREPMPTALPRPKGALRLENVVVTLPGRDAPVLQCGALSIAAGEVVAVIGPSGAGKSTLARVLAGALPPDRGIVRIDGASYADWDAERLAGAIGYVPQSPTLLAGTIAENIARFSGEIAADADFGESPVDHRAQLDAAVVAAATSVGAHEVILGLPGGYEATLGIEGQGLSGGQAQRIALARAVFGDPSVLILDEPNAHLDSEGDRQLVDSLMALKAQGKTIVVVSHKLGILPVVDRILVLREGQPIMFGPREDVMARLEGRTAGIASVSAA